MELIISTIWTVVYYHIGYFYYTVFISFTYPNLLPLEF